MFLDREFGPWGSVFRAFEPLLSCQLTLVVPEFPRHLYFCHQSPPGACTSAIEKGQNYANLMQAGNVAANTWHDSQARPSFSYFPSGASAGTSKCVYQIGTACKSISHLQPLWSGGALRAKSSTTGCAKAEYHTLIFIAPRLPIWLHNHHIWDPSPAFLWHGSKGRVLAQVLSPVFLFPAPA